MDKEKKTLIMSTIATIALIAIVIGATYAYFEAQNEASGGANIGVDAATTDVFRLTSSDAIELNANPSNFKQGDANLIGEAQASAYLRANNNTNTATYNYYVYLDIEENDFVYSVDENTPELLLKVYEGEIGENEITSIPGLRRKTTEDVEGFDITGITRAITLVNNKEITTTSEIEEKWSIEIIFVNLESDQKANQGKTLDASLRIESDNIGVQITEVIKEITKDSITVNTFVKNGLSNVETYIYGIKESIDDTTAMAGRANIVRLADGELDEEGYATYERTTPTFTFEGLKEGTLYDIKVTVKDTKGLESIKKISKIATMTNFSERVKSLFTGIDGENNLYYHDGEGTYTNANLEAGDNSYRYAGSHSSVNNYVCFGSDAEECPTENLYRIIGVFNNGGEEQVKLIKWVFATNEMLGTGSYANSDFAFPSSSYPNYKGAMTTVPRHYWSGSISNDSNMWSGSTLNTKALNTNFFGYLGSEWTEMIATTTWKVGGMTKTDRDNGAKAVYIAEMITNGSTEYEDEIGLMYVSEYMYAASPTYWSYSGYNSSDATKDYRAAINDNWMFSDIDDTPITPMFSEDSMYVYYIENTGGVGVAYVAAGSAVRPVFNLKSDVQWIGGDGSQNSPYRVGI